MGLFSRLRSTADEQRSLPPPENELSLLGAYSGSSLTPLAALAIGDVWSAVRVLADAASSLPLHVYRTAPDGARERVTSGRLVDLLDRPAPATTQADLVSTLLCHLLIYGGAYLGKYREQGDIVQLATLHPERIRPELDGGRLVWRYSPPGTGAQMVLGDADVVHVKAMSVDGLLGLSAVSQAANVLQLSDQLVKHALGYFDTGDPRTGTGSGRGIARPAGVLRLGDATAAQGMREKEQLRNVSRPHGVLVVTGTDVEYTPIETSLDSQQFAEQRRLTATEIARVFRIPPHMIGAPTGETMTYSNTEQSSIEFVRYSLTPWLRRIELAISNDPDLTFQRQFVKFEVDGLLRSDALTRAQVYEKALAAGWMSVEEVRRLEDLPVPATPPPIERAIAAIGASNGNG